MAKSGIDLEKISTDLDAFDERVSALVKKGDIETPWTTLRMIGRRNYERFWQAYLAYFCNPKRPHGFREKVLEGFLTELNREGAFDIEGLHPDRSRIKIQTEVASDDGFPDLLIWDEGQWFLCIEMKVDAGEHGDQLSRYGAADELGPVTVGDYPRRNRFYVYLVKEVPDEFHSLGEQSEEPRGKFQPITWKAVVGVIERILAEPSGQYPLRSIGQLDDFRTLIMDKMDMNEDETYVKLKEEYIEHKDAIEKANQAGQEFVARHLSTAWVEALNGDYQPELWDKAWDTHHPDTDSPGWGQIFRKHWKPDDLRIDIHFEHFPKWSRLRDGRLDLTLELETRGSGHDQKPAIQDLWKDRSEEIRSIVPDSMKVDTKKNKYLLKSDDESYGYREGDEEEYFRSLSEAIDDNKSTVALIDAILEQCPFDNPEEVDLPV